MTKKILLFGALVLCLAVQIRAADDIPPRITVSGSGEVNVQPTEALVSIAIQQRNTSVQDLRTQIDTIASNVIAFLKEQKVAAKDIQTSYITISPYYSWETTQAGGTTPDYYTGTKAMSFLLKNLKKYDTIISGLFDLGLNTINGITWRVKDENTPQLEAKRRAVENAKDIALTMATELGVQLGDVYSISDNSYSAPVFQTGIIMAAANAAVADGAAPAPSAGPSISGGTVTFNANVNVIFYILQ